MIVTLTVNPALDRAIQLEDALRPGAVQSAASAREDVGGKGLNVARVVQAAGETARAVLPLASDDPFAVVLGAAQLSAHAVPIVGHARANLTITDPAGVTTKLNLPGPVLGQDALDRLVDAVTEVAEGARWLVLAGSLPPGAGDDYYVTVIRAVRARWGAAAPKIAVDAAGAALRAVVATGAPDLIKPNDEELAELVPEVALRDAEGMLDTRALRRAAGAIVPGRVRSALITLGGEGAAYIDEHGAWLADAPVIDVRSTVGAGDASLAGYLLADIAGEPAERRLAHAVRYGAAAASLPGTQPPRLSDLPASTVPVRPLAP